jgi:hypothetical protein
VNHPALRPAWLAFQALLVAAIWTAATASVASAQGTKRLATPTPGLPWSDCKDVEGFVADAAGRYTVQSARCGDGHQIWLLGRGEATSGASTGPQVLDKRAVRSLRPGEMLSAGPYCHARGRELRWVAIYQWKGRKRIQGQSGIREAWVPNLQTQRLEPASAALVRAASCTANPDE